MRFMGGNSILEAVVVFGEILLVLLGTIFLCFHAYNETIAKVQQIRLLVTQEQTEEEIQRETSALLTGKGEVSMQKESDALQERVFCRGFWENPLYRFFRKSEGYMEMERTRVCLFAPDYLRIKYWGSKRDGS